MLARTRPALLWMLLGLSVGCRSSENDSRQYLKINDMEPASTGAIGGCKHAWSSVTYVGKQRPEVTPRPGAWTFTQLVMGHPTMPGVTSQYAARLRSEHVLDTKPAEAQSNANPLDAGMPESGEPEERLWGANIKVDFEQNVPEAASDNSMGSASPPTECPPISTDPPNGGDASKRPVDMSGFSGLVFWAKAEGTAYGWPPDAGRSQYTMKQSIRVFVRDRHSDPRGGLCNDSTDIKETRNKCYNAFSTTLDLTDSFVRYEVDFSNMWRDPNWGHPPIPYRLDARNVYSIVFQVDAAKCVSDPNATCAQEFPPLHFDFWIDDLYLVRRPR